MHSVLQGKSAANVKKINNVHLKASESAANDRYVQALKAHWKTLSIQQRGAWLRSLAGRYSTRVLGAALGGVNPKLIRDLILLSGMTKQECKAFEKLGRKKKLRYLRRRKAWIREWRKATSGPRGQNTRRRLLSTVVRWFEAELRPYFWEPCLYEINKLPHANQAIQEFIPSWEACDVNADWKQVIAATRPKRDEWSYDSLLGLYREWFIRWFFQCMPVAEVRNWVFHHSCKALRRKFITLQQTDRNYVHLSWNDWLD